METLVQDVRYAVRALRKRPGFALIAILTLAVGIGANTAIFSVVNATLLRRLPFADPDRIVAISMLPPKDVSIGRGRGGEVPWSVPKLDFVREQSHTFSQIAGYTYGSFTLVGQDSPERIDAEIVTQSYAPLLGIRPLRGRNFLPEEDAVAGKSFVALIGEGLWNRRFNADPNIVGRTIVLDKQQYTVVGVLPASFKGLTGRADLWVPLHTTDAEQLEQKWSLWLLGIARLKPGATVAQAQSEMNVLGKRLDELQPDPVTPGRHWSAQAKPLEELRVDPAIRRSVLVLFIAVGAVLLIACANVANLLLANAVARRREIAVRLAVGAGRPRLIRQLLTESTVLSVAGALAGVVVGALGVRFLVQMIASANNAFGQRLSGLSALSLSGIRLDAPALIFTIVASLITGLLFGLMPALQASRVDLTSDLKEGGSQTPGHSGARRLSSRSVLVIAELALALMLLVASGLMIKSLGRLLSVDPGFDPHNVLSMRMNLIGDHPRPERLKFWEELADRVKALTGAEQVAISDCPPLAGGCNGTVIWFRDMPEVPKGTEPEIGMHWVTPDYFKTLRVPLLRGRMFDERDRMDSPKVLIINEAAARAFYPRQNPVGRLVGVGQGGFGDTVQIVGVVANERFETVERPPRPDAFISYAQSPPGRGMLFVRTSGNSSALVGAIRREIHALDPTLPAYDVRTMEERVSDATARTRLSALLLGIFAAIALCLAAVGIYGVISFTVSQRTREIGIRVALGATRNDVLSLVLRQGLILTVVGVAIGLIGALLSSRILNAMLYDVKPSDPATYIGLALLLGIVASLATLIPALRATRADPLSAFKAT
jgi:putative ABC transport system permease protein